MEETKLCSTCGEIKLCAEFHKHIRNTDGYQSECMDCRKAINRKYRKENYPKISKAKKKNYDINKDKIRKYAIEYAGRNRKETLARNLMNYAKKKKNIIQQPCERCGLEKNICGHHEDYGKPLDVNWLCKSCHAIRHQELKTLRR